tara:strand:+ start:15654 stop:16454 length:801 start_codon:yes stop_codon:yes gene_type:complete
MSLCTRVAGVDFSGARDAGNNIWIAAGDVTPAGVRIDSLHRAADLPGGAREFAPALEALVAHVATLADHIVGFDFPFSLPAELIDQASWRSFVRSFATEFDTPERFRDRCRAITGGRELKRKCDTEARVPWCAYNLRLYRQTWSGIRHVLHPLVAENRARVIPMQTEQPGKPTIAEICPASLLKHEDLYKPYKGSGATLRASRETILRSVTRRKMLLPIRGNLRRTILDNPGGDALDAVLSALAVARIETPLPRDKYDRIESRVYF